MTLSLSLDPILCHSGMAVVGIGMKASIIALAIALAHGTPSTAIAETLGPLPSGKPAGVHQAQQVPSQTILIVGAVALLGIGVGLAVSNNGNSSTPTTMSTTSTVISP